MSKSSVPAPPSRTASDPAESDRRSSQRFPVVWAVDCLGEETFLYAEITNISHIGIFVSCKNPFEVGTFLTLQFTPGDDSDSFCLPGRVQWVNANHSLCASKHPGMGIRFVDLSPDDRERIVEVIHTIAYLHDYSN